tara:strand:- start:282 stop:524 length:243 start_codon:yes stop_codon:yes gene_type:complete
MSQVLDLLDRERLLKFGIDIIALPDQQRAKLRLDWKGESVEIPSFEELEFWSWDGIAETPAGDQVEPDHPDSWLSLLGVI